MNLLNCSSSKVSDIYLHNKSEYFLWHSIIVLLSIFVFSTLKNISSIIFEYSFSISSIAFFTKTYFSSMFLSFSTSSRISDKKFANSISSSSIPLYFSKGARPSNDLIGVELCGSIKNVIAIAAGILEGLGYVESTRSFLITESLHDIKSLIHGLGGTKKTILSYAGVGDLLLTATSKKSRNYSFGLLIGQKKLDEAKEYLENTTVEGYYTLKSIYTLIKRKKIKMPIIDLIYKIILKDENPEKLAEFLIKKI